MSAAEQLGEVAQLRAERDALRAREAASLAVLQAISASPGDPQPTLALIVRHVRALAGASTASILSYDGERLHRLADEGYTPEMLAALRAGFPRAPAQDFIPGRAVLTNAVVQVADLAAEPGVYAAARGMRGGRLAIPLRREGKVVGVLALGRADVGEFDAEAVALAQSFAEQAYIALENARLITEQREALERQTATAEVLRVISQSLTDAAPVFDRVVTTAARLLHCDYAYVLLTNGLEWWPVTGATPGGVPAEIMPDRYPVDPGADFPSRAIASRAMLHLPDWSVIDLPAFESQVRDILGAQSSLYLPFLRDGECVGLLIFVSRRAHVFGLAEIALAESFRDQALIAIENTRLFNETKEALERQTATAEVLQVINANPGNLAPVFEAMLEKAMRLCEAAFGQLATFDGTRFHIAATRGVPRAYAEFKSEPPREYGPGTGPALLLAGAPLVHVPDMKAEEVYRRGEPNRRALVDLGGARTSLVVPLRKDAAVLGTIQVYRQEVRPFSDKQIALLQDFAAQAVIAMENARLLTEQREALERQTATAEVLQVINANPGNISPVFETILEKAHALCGAAMGCFFIHDGSHIQGVATRGYAPEIDAVLRRRHPVQTIGQGLLDGTRYIHNHDVKASSQTPDNPISRAIRDSSPVRTNLLVPLRKDGQLLGVISANRAEVKPYTEAEIALLESFAAQAVIAMENARLLTEQREALERQTATAEVLQVISQSPTGVQPVFDVIIERAVRLCGARMGRIYRYDGTLIHMVGTEGLSPPGQNSVSLPFPRPAADDTIVGRVMLSRRPHILADLEAEPTVPALLRRMIAAMGARSQVTMPMLLKDAPIGAITLSWTEPHGYTDQAIALLQTFADQAVIAIENVRLFNETKEALERQTATAEVLQVINANPGNPEPAFDIILAKAHAVCGAEVGALFLTEGEAAHAAATHGYPEEIDAVLRTPRSFSGGLQNWERPVHRLDIRESAESGGVDARLGAFGVRTSLAVPLRQDGRLVGYLTANRLAVKPYTEAEVALLESFAAQAVIAMENARLLTEQREALERQTATAEVLQVINANPGNLQPVFDAILEKAHLLCGTAVGALFLYEDGQSRAVATHGYPTAIDVALRKAKSVTGRFRKLVDGAPIDHTLDLAATADRAGLEPLIAGFGVRTSLTVPLRDTGRLLGWITANRMEANAFAPADIALLESFAAQAVIAMENARLLGELRERTQELAARNDDYSEQVIHQSATIDVLQAMSGSPGDPQPVFERIAERARDICDGESVVMFQFDGTLIHVRYVALGPHQVDPAAIDAFRRAYPMPPSRMTTAGRVILDRELLHVRDMDADPTILPAVRALGYRSQIVLPLLRGEDALGAIILNARRPGGFTDSQIELMRTFAEQAVIAIGTAETYRALRARTEALAASLDDLRRTQDRLVQTEKLASLGQLTAGIAHEIKNPLNFVNNFAELSGELLGELETAVAAGDAEELADITGLLRDNLGKIATHGKRADSIVRNMLQHSRTGASEARFVGLNALADEALNLAYHGARAAEPGFNVTLERSFDPSVGEVELYPQEITRVLLNLIGNGFYAARQHAGEAATLWLSTHDHGDTVELRVRDNGAGIPDDVRAKLFQPFFTTKPTGEGTGLGLSLSHDIVVRQHGGRIAVETQPGEGTSFVVTLPRRLPNQTD